MSTTLPDFGEPTVIPIAAVVGAFVGAAWARALGHHRNAVRRLAEDMSFGFTAIALAAYLFGIASGLY
ncbi:MAG TPA: hypothetical protein VEK39_08500 [Solirubrobacterales bacterium]|nr:hypothetical protein [Solirubrobacterales bacterium]